MIYILTHNILPVFSMLALGFLMGRMNQVSHPEAAALNRIAFLVLQPALIFPLINGLDWSEFRVEAVGLYALCQTIVFVVAFVIAKFALRRDTVEAWLLGMATIFVNTLLYIWPISFLIYGEAAAIPITAIVAWDASVSFAFFIITTDMLANRQSSAVQSMRRVAMNPVLIAIALGVISNLVNFDMPEPILTALDFAGSAAAPLTLFALGVILSGHALKLSPTVAVMSLLKLILFPVLVWGAMQFAGESSNWNALLILTAAGPAGAMAFSLAVLHGVRTDQIALVVIWTSTLSLFSLAWLA